MNEYRPLEGCQSQLCIVSKNSHTRSVQFASVTAVLNSQFNFNVGGCFALHLSRYNCTIYNACMCEIEAFNQRAIEKLIVRERKGR